MVVHCRLFVSAGEFLPDFICVGVGEADAVHIHHHDKFGSCRMLDIQCIIPELFQPFSCLQCLRDTRCFRDQLCGAQRGCPFFFFHAVRGLDADREKVIQSAVRTTIQTNIVNRVCNFNVFS